MCWTRPCNHRNMQGTHNLNPGVHAPAVLLTRATNPEAGTWRAAAGVRALRVGALRPGLNVAVLADALARTLVDVGVHAGPRLRALSRPCAVARPCLAHARKAADVVGADAVDGIAVMSRGTGTLVNVEVGTARAASVVRASDCKAFAGFAVGWTRAGRLSGWRRGRSGCSRGRGR